MNFDDIKVGDEVCQVDRAGWSRRIYSVKRGKVERVTKTQIIALGSRFSRAHGGEIGTPGYSGSLQRWTAEIQKEFEEDRALGRAESDAHKAAKILDAARDQDALRYAELARKILDMHNDPL